MMLKKLPASRAVMMAVAFLALIGILMIVNWTATGEARKITLVYVGAENCGPCDNWQRNQEIAFRNSPEFQRLAYREVKSPNLFDVLNDIYWPEDLWVYRRAISKSAGVPLWLVIADDQLILQGSGLTLWHNAILPKIQSLTGRKMSDQILAMLFAGRKIEDTGE
jgi:hypothetical protein